MRQIKEFNFPAFFAAEFDLEQKGYYVHNPAREDWDAGFLYGGATGNEDMATLWPDDVKPKTLRDVLAEDIEWILTYADGVAVLPGWERSMGARAEVSAALAAGIYVARVEDFRTPVLEDTISITGPRIAQVPPLDVAVQVDAEEARSRLVSTLRSLGDGLRSKNDLADEIRVTSATGGQKGKKLAQLGSLDPKALLAVAEVSGFGANKYARYNYLKGYDWSLSFDALQRHLLAFWAGQDQDPESGLLHLAHAAWHCLALISFLSRGIGTDDRFKEAA